MRMASYQQTLRRLQPIVPILFDSLQSGLTMSREDHERKKIKRTGDPHFFAHTVRRETCEKLRAKGLLVTDPEEERSALARSSIQVQHNGVLLWVFRSQDGQIPLPVSPLKQRYYRQEPTLEGWDNLILLWADDDAVLRDPMHLIRPLGGDHRRASLRTDWSGPLARRMANMRVEDLNVLQPEHQSAKLEGDGPS